MKIILFISLVFSMSAALAEESIVFKDQLNLDLGFYSVAEGTYSVVLMRRHPYLKWNPEKVYFKRIDHLKASTGLVQLDQSIQAYASMNLLQLIHEQKIPNSYLHIRTMEPVSLDKIPSSLRSQALKFFEPGEDELVMVLLDQNEMIVAQKVVTFTTGPSIQVRSIEDLAQGFTGNIYEPLEANPGKTIVLWGGSGGTYSKGWAYSLARAGYRVVAIEYFTKDPKNSKLTFLIHRLNLDIFIRAIEFANSLSTSPQKIAILGESRGGEAALLLAKYYPQKLMDLGVDQIFALRPLHFSVGAKISGELFDSAEDAASWVWGVDEKEVPYLKVPWGYSQQAWSTILNQSLGLYRELPSPIDGKLDPVLYLRSGFEAMEQEARQVNQLQAFLSAQDLEAYAGQIILLAGQDDAAWQADRAVSEIRKARLASGHQQDVCVIVPEAGHYIDPSRASAADKAEIDFYLFDERFFFYDGGHGVANAINDYMNTFIVKNVLGNKVLKLSTRLSCE